MIEEDEDLFKGPSIELYDSDILVDGQFKTKYITYIIPQENTKNLVY